MAIRRVVRKLRKQAPAQRPTQQRLPAQQQQRTQPLLRPTPRRSEFGISFKTVPSEFSLQLLRARPRRLLQAPRQAHRRFQAQLQKAF